MREKREKTTKKQDTGERHVMKKTAYGPWGIQPAAHREVSPSTSSGLKDRVSGIGDGAPRRPRLRLRNR